MPATVAIGGEHELIAGQVEVEVRPAPRGG